MFARSLETFPVKIISIVIIIGGILFLFVRGKRSKTHSSGTTIYEPIGIKIEYPSIDLEKKQVIGKVLCNNKVYLTVKVDVQSNTCEVIESVAGLADLFKGKDILTESDYIEQIKANANFIVENKISNPTTYYEELINQAN